MLRSKIKLCIVIHLKVFFFVHVLLLACAKSFQAPGFAKVSFFFSPHFSYLKMFLLPTFYIILPFSARKFTKEKLVSLDRNFEHGFSFP